MPYFSTIPQPTDRRSKSQQQFKNNFSSIETVLKVNHADFDSPNQGQHNALTFPLQVADPVILATEAALYSKNSVASAQPELFFKRGLSAPIQMSGMGNTTVGGESYGWSYLPSGMLIKWAGGIHIAGPTATQTITLNTGPAFTGMFSSIVTLQNNLPENKVLYIQDYNLGAQTVTLHTTTRYGGNTAISDYYINLLVFGI